MVVIYFRMVHTRQGTRTEPPSIKGRNRGRNAQDWQDEDLFDDTISHTLVWASESLWGKNHRSWRRAGTKLDRRSAPNKGGTTRKNGGIPIDHSNRGALALYWLRTSSSNSQGSNGRHGWLHDSSNSSYTNSMNNPRNCCNHGQCGVTYMVCQKHEGNGL